MMVGFSGKKLHIGLLSTKIEAKTETLWCMPLQVMPSRGKTRRQEHDEGVSEFSGQAVSQQDGG